MYYLLRYYKEETQLVGLLFKKGVLEFVVKILDLQRVSKNSFLKLNFLQIVFKDFDHNYYNNSLKYAANRTIFSLTSATVSTKSELFLEINILVNLRISASNN